jgi:hypothetical protein
LDGGGDGGEPPLPPPVGGGPLLSITSLGVAGSSDSFFLSPEAFRREIEKSIFTSGSKKTVDVLD